MGFIKIVQLLYALSFSTHYIFVINECFLILESLKFILSLSLT